MNVHQQWLMASYMLITGGILGIAFDFCRVMSAQFKVIRLVRWVLDCFYWLFATIITFSLLFKSNQGEFRFIIFMFILIGGIIYFHLFSSRMYKFMVFLCLSISKIVRIVMAPIFWIYRVGRRMICAVTNRQKQKK